MHAHLVNLIHELGPHAAVGLLQALLLACPRSCSRAAGGRSLVCKQRLGFAVVGHNLSTSGRAASWAQPCRSSSSPLQAFKKHLR